MRGELPPATHRTHPINPTCRVRDGMWGSATIATPVGTFNVAPKHGSKDNTSASSSRPASACRHSPVHLPSKARTVTCPSENAAPTLHPGFQLARQLGDEATAFNRMIRHNARPSSTLTHSYSACKLVLQQKCKQKCKQKRSHGSATNGQHTSERPLMAEQAGSNSEREHTLQAIWSRVHSETSPLQSQPKKASPTFTAIRPDIHAHAPIPRATTAIDKPPRSGLDRFGCMLHDVRALAYRRQRELERHHHRTGRLDAYVRLVSQTSNGSGQPPVGGP